MNNNSKKGEAEIIGNFSVALGLFDYINPIFYGITSITIMRNMIGHMDIPIFIVFVIGTILSLVFGISIPTVKLLVGLGKMKFEMPVNLVSFVNLGILLSGIALFYYAIGIKPFHLLLILITFAIIIAFLWHKTGKYNTAAVLIGAVGYLMIYVSLIILSIRNEIITPIFLYGFAIILFIFLCFIGIFANLKNAKVHWVIEISNVICQFSVMLGTVILF